MKKLLYIAFLTIIITSCVESLTENPNEVPELSITSPKSNDTVQIGRNFIKYSAKDYFGGTGLDRFELVINKDEENLQTFKLKTNQNPFIYFDLDPSLLGSYAEYSLTAFNKEGKSTSLEAKNLYIGENKNPPNQPDTLKLHRVSTSEIVLVWIDNSINEEGFDIHMKEGENGTYNKIATIGAGKTTFKYTSLSPYVVYFFKVRAFNKYGQSVFSNEVNSTQAGGNEPYDLRGESLGAKVVYLSWKNMISYYEVLKIQRKVESATIWTDIENNIPETTQEYYDRKDLYPLTTYNYRIAARILGNWVYSNDITVKTYSIDVPTPKNVVATFDASINKVKITWDTYPQNVYKTLVQKKEGFNGIYIDVGSVTTNVNYILDDNIDENKTYYYRAKFLTTENFYTMTSNEDTAKVGYFAPLAPVSLKISKIINTSNQYLLEWIDNSSSEDGFKIYYRQYGSGNYIEFAGNPYLPNTTAASVSTPTNDTYYFIVRSFKGNLLSVPSNEVSTNDGVTSFNLTGAYNGSAVNMNWTKPDGNVIAYKVERSLVWPESWQQISNALPNSTTSYSDNSVTKQRDYMYRIVAVYDNLTKYSTILKISTY